MSDFRGDGEAALDWVAGYLERVGELPVASKVSPGDVREALAFTARAGEPFEAVLRDLDAAICRASRTGTTRASSATSPTRARTPGSSPSSSSRL